MKLIASAARALQNLSPRTRRLLVHDAALYVAAFVATGVLASGNLTADALVAAAVSALKVVLRKTLPVPPAV